MIAMVGCLRWGWGRVGCMPINYIHTRNLSILRSTSPKQRLQCRGASCPLQRWRMLLHTPTPSAVLMCWHCFHGYTSSSHTGPGLHQKPSYLLLRVSIYEREHSATTFTSTGSTELKRGEKCNFCLYLNIHLINPISRLHRATRKGERVVTSHTACYTCNWELLAGAEWN